MSDCSIEHFAPYSVEIASDNPIFRRVAELLADVRTNVYGLSLPNIGNFDLGVNVGSVDATLKLPTEPALALPQLQGVTVGALQSATYSALNSTIHFSYSSPLVPPLTYVTGQGHLALPDVDVNSPPVAYPLVAQLALPNEPSLPSTAKPTITLGNRPTLDNVSQITFTPTAIAPLDMPNDILDGVDEFASMLPELSYRVQENYVADAAAIAKLKRLLSGDDEIAVWLAQQVILYAADTKRIPVEIKRKLDEIFEQAAAKNFALPNGITDAQVAAVAQAELIQRQDVIDKVEAEVLDAALGAILASINAAIQVEKYHAALYIEYVRQNIEIYKLNVAAATAVFNGLLKTYEVYTEIVKQHVENYNRYVEAVTDQNRAVAAGIEIASAEIATYNARVAMYRADSQTLRNIAEVDNISVKTQILPLQVYEAKLRGLLANYDIFKTNVQAYKQAIQNYAKSFQLIESKISSFAAAVRAEASKADVVEANVRAYVRALGAERQRLSSYEDYIRSSTSVLESEVNALRAAIDAERSYLMAANETLQANIQTLRNYLNIAQTQQGVVNAYNMANITYTRNKDRLELAKEELEIAKKMIKASEITQLARLKSALDEIKVRANGALAQAASTIYNVGISAAGTTQQSVSGTSAASAGQSYSTRLAWNRACRQEVRALRG